MRFPLFRVLLAIWLVSAACQLSASDALTTEAYQVTLDASRKIMRSGVLGEKLTWVIVQNGMIVLERNAANELSYTYYDNRIGNEYFVYLHKWGGTHYVRVSNIVGYRFGLESNAPLITSARSAVAIVNQPFRYEIQATGDVNQFTAANLPAGLVLDENGVISGIPTAVGNHEVVLTATAGLDVGTAGLTLSVASGVNDGGFTSRHTLVLDSTYEVTWNEDPANTDLTMIVKQNDVVVLGRNVLASTTDSYFYNTPGRVYTIHLESAINGVYRRVSNTVLYEPGKPAGFPTITSPLTAVGMLGVNFSGYQIVGQNGPTSFSASGLPGGLSLSPSGLISGKPTESGTFSVLLKATNAVGAFKRQLTLTINPNPGIHELFTLSADAEDVVLRSAGELPGLTWVVREDDVERVRRPVAGDEGIRYQRANISSAYTVHLEAWLNSSYRRVSNTETIAGVPDEQLRMRAFGAPDGLTVFPKSTLSEMPDGSGAMGIVYTVNLTDDSLVLTLEQSTDLRDWTPVIPLRRILQSEETFELREDLMPLEEGPPRFFRVTVSGVQP